MLVHVYRNRPDDQRGPDELHYCTACHGWYGIPHDDSHCQDGVLPVDNRACACALCREFNGKPIEGGFGFKTNQPEWQPPKPTVWVVYNCIAFEGCSTPQMVTSDPEAGKAWVDEQRSGLSYGEWRYHDSHSPFWERGDWVVELFEVSP